MAPPTAEFSERAHVQYIPARWWRTWQGEGTACIGHPGTKASWPAPSLARTPSCPSRRPTGRSAVDGCGENEKQKQKHTTPIKLLSLCSAVVV